MDARIIRSQGAIKKTFLELLSETPLQKITVTDICNGAGVNRATFYKYYEGAEDLLNKIEDQMLAELCSKIERAGVDSLQELVEIVVDEVNREYDSYSILFVNDGNSDFIRKMIVALNDVNMRLLSDSFPKLDDETRELLYYFIMSGVMGVFNVWYARGRVDPVAKIKEFCLGIAEHISEYGKHYTGKEFM